MAADQETSRTDLSYILNKRLTELGIGTRTLAASCIDPENPSAGPLWTRGTLDNLRAGVRIKAPEFAELRALAAGLRLGDVGLLQEAAGSQYFGIDTVWSEDGKVRALVIGFAEMDPEEQDKVLALIAARRSLATD
jgi:hypothetical protein